MQILNARPILDAFRALPKEASAALRDKATQLAAGLVPDLQAAARREGAQAALMAGTIKAKRDRVPVIEAGGRKRVGRRRVPAGALIFGSEYGSNARQFKRHLSGGSYWFRETVEEQDSKIYAEWITAADQIIRAYEGSV